MRVTKQFDLVVENEDDVSALQKFVRPMEFNHCAEAYNEGDKTLWDRLGFNQPWGYPALVSLGAQNMFVFFPAPKSRKRKSNKRKVK